MTRGISYYDKQPAFTSNIVIEISVPSGLLIADNDFRSTPHFDIDPPLSINYGFGCDVYSKEFAEKANTAYASVGNSSPSIIRLDDGHFDVVNGSREGETLAAWICTDLWAVMLTDYQNWLDNDGPEATKDDSCTVFDVTPGKYRWTVFSHSDRFDPDRRGRVTYAKLDLIEAY